MHLLAHTWTQMYWRLNVCDHLCQPQDADESKANSSSVLGRAYVLEWQRNTELVWLSLINGTQTEVKYTIRVLQNNPKDPYADIKYVHSKM